MHDGAETVNARLLVAVGEGEIEKAVACISTSFAIAPYVLNY